MLITDRRATVRLHFELSYLMLCADIRSLSGYLSELQLAYLEKSTFSGDHSLPVKVGTGQEQSLASNQGNASRQDKQVICEVEISTDNVNRWHIFKSLCGRLPCKLRAVSFYNGAIITKLTTLSIRKKRSENSLDVTEPKSSAQQQNVIPVNHNEMKMNNFHGKLVAQTINYSCYLWDGGPVLLKYYKGRGLNTGCIKHIRSYSTKTTTEAPSWNDNKVAKRLESLWNGNKKDSKFINEGLWKLLKETNLWTAAYLKLSKSKGSSSVNKNKTSLEGTTLDALISLKNDIISGTHEFGTTKRLYITKANKKANEKLRALSVLISPDRIVQEVVRTILEVIYEPNFSNHSHAFRPGRNCHTALRHIKQHSSGYSWVIEGNIKGLLNNMDHKILLSLLNKKIKDPRFISLIYKILKTRVKEEDFKENISLNATPQESILSPLLSNVMLHEFDIFMENYIKKYNRGKGRKINPEYERIWFKLGIKAARKVPYFKYNDPSYRRMHYVRFADVFIITLNGPKNEALNISNRCVDFLNDLNLTLSPDKTLITNPNTKEIPFLGYLIKNLPEQKYYYSRLYGDKFRQISKIKGGQVYLKADLKKVVQKLSDKGFCLKNGYPIPNFSLLNETQYGTLIKVSKIIKGISSYYILATNYLAFISRINYIIRYSTAKMFAAKYKLSSIAKVFEKAGKNLSKPLNNKNTKLNKSVNGKTEEEKWYAYLKSIGVSQSNMKDNSKIKIGIPYINLRDKNPRSSKKKTSKLP